MKQNSLVIIGAVFTALYQLFVVYQHYYFSFFGVSNGVFEFFTTLEYTRVPLAILSTLLSFYYWNL